MMEKLIYGMCALTAALVALLLLRGYLRTRHRLLLWSGACFVGLTANNVMLVVDRVLLPAADLSTVRLVLALAAVLLLVVGLVMEDPS
jgi:hypothetical protein